MELNDPALLDLKQVADKLSPPPKLGLPLLNDGAPLPPPGHVICGAFKDGCHGNGFIPIPEIRVVNTRLDLGSGAPLLVTLRDNLCEACRKQAKGAVMLACVHCRCIVARFKPFEDKTTGFRFLPGQVYHCDICFHCLETEAKQLAASTGKPFEDCLLGVARERAAKGRPLPESIKDISATVLEKELFDRNNRNRKIYVGSH